MSKFFLALIPTAFLAGCSVSSEVDITGSKKGSAPAPEVELKGALEGADVALFHGDRSIKVGDNWPHALSVFPEPARGAYEIHDLPPEFNDKFEARGWETNRDEGLGAILTDNKIAGVVYELEHVTEDATKEYIQDQIEGMAPRKAKKIDQGTVIYWFWHGKDQTLMICRLQTKQGFNLTVAMGDDNVLHQIGASEDDAKKQLADIQRNSGSKVTPAPAN